MEDYTQTLQNLNEGLDAVRTAMIQTGIHTPHEIGVSNIDVEMNVRAHAKERGVDY